jgi:hypothetical protein
VRCCQLFFRRCATPRQHASAFTHLEMPDFDYAPATARHVQWRTRRRYAACAYASRLPHARTSAERYAFILRRRFAPLSRQRLTRAAATSMPYVMPYMMRADVTLFFCRACRAMPPTCHAVKSRCEASMLSMPRRL